MALGLYIHIPFCRRRCHYCAFYSVAERNDVFDLYMEALMAEFALRRNTCNTETVDSIYFGGGTPSLFEPERIAFLLDELSIHYRIPNQAEITLELNPAAVNAADLDGYRAAGVNRLSIGVQSFNDHLLRAIGRDHTGADAVRVVCNAYRAGFSDLTIDLMYGLPGQTEADFVAALKKAMHLPIGHLSVYGLTIESNTYFSNLLSRGRLSLPTESEEWRMYRAMSRIARHYGFERYELSNFARHKQYARHNLKYWRYGSYLGFGAAATSFYNGKRTTHVADWSAYIAGIREGNLSFAEVETISPPTAIEEYCFMHLRLAEGISYENFESRFGQSFRSCYGSLPDHLIRRGYLRETVKGLALTERGAAIANRVMAEFILTATPQKSDS